MKAEAEIREIVDRETLAWVADPDGNPIQLAQKRE